MKKEKAKDHKVIIEIACFMFAYQSNAERVAIALATGGYFVRVSKSSETSWFVWVYKGI